MTMTIKLKFKPVHQDMGGLNPQPLELHPVPLTLYLISGSQQGASNRFHTTQEAHIWNWKFSTKECLETQQVVV